MPELLWLFAAALAVGLMIGATGIGGILLIPAFAAFAGLTLRESMATALFTFMFTGIAGSYAYQRRRSIDWSIAAPVCLGAVPLGFAGAWLNARASEALLSPVLAGIIIFAGLYALARPHGRAQPVLENHPAARRALLVGVGALAGLGAGLVGVGGPALSLPLMVLAGFPMLACIATAQAVQVAAAGSGTLGNLQFGSIDVGLALPVLALEVAGVMAGARAAHAINPMLLKRLVGVLCILVGIVLLVRAPVNG